MLADRLVEAARYTSIGNTEGLWRSTCHSAYYAVFHALCDSGEALLFKDAEAGRLARRAVTHDSILKRANHYRSAQPGVSTWNSGQWRSDRASTVPSDELVRVAESIVALQSLRIDADYNPELLIGEGDAKFAVSKSRRSVETVKTLAAAEDPAIVEFLRWMYFPNKPR